MANNNKRRSGSGDRANGGRLPTSPWASMTQGDPSRTHEIPAMIASARTLIHSERPIAALEQLTDALRIMGGEKLIFETLAEARQNYWQGRPPAEDSLAGLLQACSLGHHMPLAPPATSSGAPHGSHRTPAPPQPELAQDKIDASVLADQGRESILVSAVEHTSSQVCDWCGSVVGASRFEQHREMWCPALPGDSDDNDQDAGDGNSGGRHHGGLSAHHDQQQQQQHMDQSLDDHPI